MPHLRPLRRSSSKLKAALATCLAASLTLTVVATAIGGSPATAAAVQPVTLKPAQLPRGADQSVPHVEGTTLVDGSIRVPIDAERIDYLGRSSGDYLVSALDDAGSGPVLRVTPGGTTSTVLTPFRNGDLVVLSSDGTRLAQARVKGGFRSSRVTVWSTTDGAVLARRTFPGIQTVLDLDAKRVVLGNLTGTRVWRPAANTTKTLSARGGYLADLGSDRLASLTGDPYDGGCTVVTRLSAPTQVLWRSCAERVESFSPDGRRMATVDLLSDGIGPSQVFVRSIIGSAKGVYRVRGYFGLLTWESSKALLLETFGRAEGAPVRCTGPTCERAGELVTTPDLRSAVRRSTPAALRAAVSAQR